jgi:LPXTG-site transpeptidase (sortase) family protein
MKKQWLYFVLPFFLIFVFSFLTINWSRISWIFDWRVIGRISEEVFIPSEKEEFGENALGQENHLVISTLDIEVPLRTPETSDDALLISELDLGVVHYPNSAKPGEQGKAVILGHSAPEGYPDIKFDRVFSQLGDLKKGDEVNVYYNERLFIYIVDEVKTMTIEEYNQYLLQPTQEYLLIISTCYPPGKNWQRWVATSSLLTE